MGSITSGPKKVRIPWNKLGEDGVDAPWRVLRSRWKRMKERCVNPNHIAYKYYGGRGVRVCKEWNDSYLKFEEWCYANGYIDGLWLDRIDNDGDYGPNNCRFVTPLEQAKNKRKYGSVKI